MNQLRVIKSCLVMANRSGIFYGVNRWNGIRLLHIQPAPNVTGLNVNCYKVGAGI